MKINVHGEMPGRLIPLTQSDLLIKIEKANQKENIYDQEPYLDLRRIKIKTQKNAFEDRFGRINKNISYPHSSGEGFLEETLACLRMLSQKFDLPFRKDLLKRVIGEQL